MYLSDILVEGYRASCRGPIKCELPGRFAVLAGANSSGKTTVTEAILLAHPDVFPHFPRPRANRLARAGNNRKISVQYQFEDPENSPLGQALEGQGPAPTWETELSTSLGRIAVNRSGAPFEHVLPVVHLSATRTPNFDLGGRDARLLVELLKAEALRTRGDNSLKELRGKISGMMRSLVSQWPIDSAEERVGGQLNHLTGGTSLRVPYLAPSAIDDAVLARVFEFLLATGEREGAIRVEDDGLGYANLLQLAVVLSAIPDPTDMGAPDDVEEDGGELDDQRTDDERQAEMVEAEEQRENEDDSFFPPNFHALVLVEEPEAHLHPQLHHALVGYLKATVASRPELQVVLTTHSDRIVAASDPNDLVVLHTNIDGSSSSTSIRSLALTTPQRRQLARHLDTTRSASIFGSECILVEGQTDAMMTRFFGRLWAAEDSAKKQFVEAMTITELGNRVGEWLPRTLANPGHEISRRCAVLKDTDGKAPPAWSTTLNGEVLQVFWSDPTLEPSITPGNETVVGQAVSAVDGNPPSWESGSPSKAEIAEWVAKAGRPRKAAFAEAFLDHAADVLSDISVPTHIGELWDFLWSSRSSPDDPESTDES